MRCCWILFDTVRKYITHGWWYVLRFSFPSLLLFYPSSFMFYPLYFFPFLPVPCVWPVCGTHIAAALPCGLDAPARADAGRDQDFLQLLCPVSVVIIGENVSHAHDYIPETNGRTAITPGRPTLDFRLDLLLIETLLGGP